MSVVYDGSHSVIFIKSSQSLNPGDTLSSYTSLKHSWDDFHLIPSSKPIVNTPEPMIAMVNDMVSSKVFDITDRIAGGQVFGPKSGSWSFIVDHDQWSNWYTAKRTIEEYLNGQRLYCYLQDDPTTVYYGRFQVENWSDGAEYSTIDISYDLDYDTYFRGD